MGERPGVGPIAAAAAASENTFDMRSLSEAVHNIPVTVELRLAHEDPKQQGVDSDTAAAEDSDAAAAEDSDAATAEDSDGCSSCCRASSWWTPQINRASVESLVQAGAGGVRLRVPTRITPQGRGGGRPSPSGRRWTPGGRFCGQRRWRGWQY